MADFQNITTKTVITSLKLKAQDDKSEIDFRNEITI